MSERLERIKVSWKEREGVRGHIEGLDVDWLIEQADRKEGFKNLHKSYLTKYTNAVGEINDLKEENARLIVALKEIESWTRNPKEYEPSYYSINHLARTALEGESK